MSATTPLPPPPPPPYPDKGYNNYQGAPPGPTLLQPVYIGAPAFVPSDYPVRCVCPSCNQSIMTRIDKKAGLLTWVLAGGLCFIGCWFGCCLIPFCVGACKDTAHFCPNCSYYFGVKNQLG